MKTCVICILLGVSLFFNACKGEKSSSKKLSNGLKSLSIDLSDVSLRTDEPAFLDFDFVRLETRDESLFAGIQKVAISDSIFFILTKSGGPVMDVMAFDKSGKYLFKLHKGRARNELTFPTDIAFSEETEQLFVYDIYRKIKIYDKNGVFIKSIHSDNVSFFLETIGDRFVTFDGGLDKTKDFYGEIREGGKVVKTFFPKKGDQLKTKTFPSFYPFLKVAEDTVLVSFRYSDTVYAVTNGGDSVKPHYVLDYHGKSMNQSRMFDQISNGNVYREICEEEGMGSGISCFSKQGEQLFFHISADDINFARYDLLNDRASLHKDLISGLPNRYGNVGSNSEYTIYSMSASRLYKYFKENPVLASDPDSAKKLRDIVNEEDNPILIFCRLNADKGK